MIKSKEYICFMTAGQFNIRVYGILINDKNEVLVTDELIKGYEMTKFPGGGLEFREGTIDCIKREFMEETKMEVEVVEHFYTTDFFQQSAFQKNHQIISIYYLVKSLFPIDVLIKQKIFDFERKLEQEQNFRWIPLNKISKTDFTLPIDKVVGDMLQKKFNSDSSSSKS